jgi:hypothetical protein
MPDLIALTDLQTITGLNRNVEERRVKNAIEDAHRSLKKVLGRTGYAVIYDNAPTFTAQTPNEAQYVALLTTYIKPYMAWLAKANAYPDLYAEADTAGVFTKSGEDFSSVSGKDLSMLINTAKGRSEERRDDLIQYLQDNKAVFTWYDTTVPGEERIDQNTGTRAGISFRRSCRQDSYRG